ncbi:MAG: carbonic anhydrase [Pseudomonadota bacterium]
MKSYKQLLLANKAWAAERHDENRVYFEHMAAGENPEFLWIGSIDSRTGPEQMTMTPPGGFLTHRNIANLVNEDDISLRATLQFALRSLNVRHVIVCGHHNCNGINAVVAEDTSGPCDAWLENVREVARHHVEELRPLEGQARANRLVELNVRAQLLKLAHLPEVAERLAKPDDLYLHGWVYDIREGLIKPLLEIDHSTALDKIKVPEPVL